jgi:hypothetical protein
MPDELEEDELDLGFALDLDLVELVVEVDWVGELDLVVVDEPPPQPAPISANTTSAVPSDFRFQRKPAI